MIRFDSPRTPYKHTHTLIHYIDINITTLCTTNIFTIHFSFAILTLHLSIYKLTHQLDPLIFRSYTRFLSVSVSRLPHSPISYSVSHECTLYVHMFRLVFCRAAIFDPLQCALHNFLMWMVVRYSLKVALERHKFNGLHSGFFFLVIFTQSRCCLCVFRFFLTFFHMPIQYTHLHISGSYDDF